MPLPGSTIIRDESKTGAKARKTAENSVLFIAQADDGGYSEVSLTGAPTSTSAIAITGLPTISASIRLKIEVGGQVGTMTFRISTNDGVTYGDIISTSGETSPYAYTDTYGIIYTFTDAAALYFVATEYWAFSSTKGSLPATLYTGITADNYVATFKSGVMVDKLKIFFNTLLNGKYPPECVCARPPNDVAASISSVVGDAGNSATDIVVGASGTALKDMEVIMKVVLLAGVSGVFKYQYSLDNGLTWSQSAVSPTSGSNIYLGEGVLFSFTDGATPPAIGDKWTFTTTSKKASNPLLAMTDSLVTPVIKDHLKYEGDKFTAIRVVGESDLADWNVMTTLMNQLDAEKLPVFSIFESLSKTSSQTYVQWKDAIKLEEAVYYDSRMNICATLITLADGSIVNPADELAPYIALTPTNESPGKVLTNRLIDVTSIVDENEVKPYLNSLGGGDPSVIVDTTTGEVEGRFTVVMTHPGTDGYYFGNANLLSDRNASSFKYLSDMRVAIKVQRSFIFHATQLINSDFVATDGLLDIIAIGLNDSVKADMANEITDLTIRVTSTLDELKNDNLFNFEAVIDKRLTLKYVNGVVSYS